MGAASAPTPYIWSTRVPVWMYGELTSGSMPRDPHWRVYVPKEAAVKTTHLDAFFDHGWNAHDVDALMTFTRDRPVSCTTRAQHRFTSPAHSPAVTGSMARIVTKASALAGAPTCFDAQGSGRRHVDSTAGGFGSRARWARARHSLFPRRHARRASRASARPGTQRSGGAGSVEEGRPWWLGAISQLTISRWQSSLASPF
jgi:hypothetical protein